MAKRIVVVGSINLDLVAGVSRMPQEGETLAGTAFETYSGGKGANQAVGAARLGADVALVGCFGNDLFAERLRRDLEQAGVDTSASYTVDRSSGSAIIMVTPHGGNSIVVIPGANAELTAEHLEEQRELFRDASIILTQLEIPLPTVEALARMASELNVPLMLDPAPACSLRREILEHVTWLTPNETETRRILEPLEHRQEQGQDAVEAAAARLLETGVRNVVLKLGERGVYLAGRDVEPVYLPPFRVQAVDTTAAGDAFNAGFAFALTNGKLPKEAARFACAVAAISVTREGAQPSMPAFAEVEELMANATPVFHENPEQNFSSAAPVSGR